MLGPLLVARDGAAVDIGPPKQRAVLAMSLLAQGRVVSVDRLLDAVWGDDVPGRSGRATRFRSRCVRCWIADWRGWTPAVLQVLRIAAVIGDAIDFPVLVKSIRLDLDTLADYLDEAADERIVVTWHSGGGYAFAHGLLREQLLASMPALRRQRLHAKLAEVFADGGGDDALTRRARHLVSAQPLVGPGVVVDACRRAAEEATQQWSSGIAAKWSPAALDAYDRLPLSARDDARRSPTTC